MFNISSTLILYHEDVWVCLSIQIMWLHGTMPSKCRHLVTCEQLLTLLIFLLSHSNCLLFLYLTLLQCKLLLFQTNAEPPCIEGASRLSQSHEPHLNGNEHVANAAVRQA